MTTSRAPSERVYGDAPPHSLPWVSSLPSLLRVSFSLYLFHFQILIVYSPSSPSSSSPPPPPRSPTLLPTRPA
ncbi:hypothetical protein B0H12DRAFT_1148915 [Mycena haematopus]|nr:hypothetical protein B0H12DRAFT_1148915 [Mycena haematopus]